MQNSKAYDCLIKQLNANGSEKMDGYYPEVMEEIYDWEREEVEDIIWDAFFNKNEIELAQFFPKLKKYDGIKALKESPYLLQIPSEASVEIGKILYEATGDEGYLDIIKKNIDASPETISFVSILSYCKPCQRLYNILVDIYINNSNKVNRSTAVMGILYNKGIIKDRGSIKESNDVISLRKKFKSEDSIERQKILEKFEAVCAMLALDLIGVKVFRYSDETAEAVASGEKLLKESGTIYESFADMMSPEDAKRYLDFLENGSREGLTGAELAGVEKADALLVSQKVGYEDVWDLRNAGDLLESGSKGGTSTVQKVLTDNPFDEAGNLKHNIKYQTGEFKYNYETDANGRISNWNTDNLQLTERDGRLNYNSDSLGKIEGDHAGHIAGDRFGGSPELDNIVSQSQNVNLSQYKKIENQWAKAISEGKEVTVNIDIKYDGDGFRPIEFNVEYTIDGDFFSQSILN